MPFAQAREIDVWRTRRALRQRLFRIAEVRQRDQRRRQRFGHAWRDRFAAVVSGSEITRLKPAPDVYLEVLRQLGLDADACLAFEDSANGIRSAGAAGLAVIATPTWYSLAESLPPAFVSLPHLGDPDHPLPKDAPGAPYVDLARLREWHQLAVAHEPLGRAACY